MTFLDDLLEGFVHERKFASQPRQLKIRSALNMNVIQLFFFIVLFTFMCVCILRKFYYAAQTKLKLMILLPCSEVLGL